MSENELVAGKITDEDNTINVEMTLDEIWFLKTFIKNFNPRKIVEIGISAGGNTINLLQWKNKDAELFSVDIATKWYQDNSKLSGWMADELDVKDNWKLYRGYDYLDIYKEIGNDIDFIIIDTVHVMPGEFLTFLAALPQLKDGCVVILHDIHLNMLHFSRNYFRDYANSAYCTGLLFAAISSSKKWTLKSNTPNIGAFIVDKSTRDNIKDVFHSLCSGWYSFPSELNLTEYSKFINENYSSGCYNLFYSCLKLQSKYFNHQHKHVAQIARVDILNSGNIKNNVEILNTSDFVDINCPDWFKTDEGRGIVIQTKEKSFYFKLKCIQKGLLKIILRGPDLRDSFDNVIPNYVDFNSFRINDEEILKDNVSVWHDEPYIFEKNVKNGEIIEINIDWKYFNSSKI